MPTVKARRLDSVGYVSIPTFTGSGERALRFARSVRHALLGLDQEPPCGWIVDLRKNEGGNMYPALLGLADLAGQGRIGGVVGGPIPQYWHLANDRVLISDLEDVAGREPDSDSASASTPIVRGVRRILSAELPSLKAASAARPVAVLVGPHTSSSGEGIAISLLGRPNSRSFGMPTKGRTTANIGTRLADGAMLIVTYGAFVDRDGKSYRPRIEPAVAADYHPLGDLSSYGDLAVKEATAWISTHACP